MELLRSASKPYSLREQWELFNFSRRHDLLHVPHFNIPVFGAKKLVVTVHDLIYLKDKRYSASGLGRAYVRMMFKKIEKKADAVLTVSEYTKADLLHSFPGLRGRVFVTYEGASALFRPIHDREELRRIQNKYSLHPPFVLFVGSLKSHKNVSVLIEAMAALKNEKRSEQELVLVGRKDEKEKGLLALIRKNSSFVKTLGEVSDEDLAVLYNLAEVFVLPSLWEGFGLPALEAMACGTPVLSSDRSSLPEVVGQAGSLFDPTRVDALKELLYTVLESRPLREKMSEMGLVQAKKFSWDKTADSTLDVYERVLG